MTWTKVSDTLIDDPDLHELPRGVRLLSIEGAVHCNRHGTDGAIRRSAVPRFTDEPDWEAAADQLVAAGLWRTTPDGWQIVGFLRDQRAKVDVDQDRYEERERKARSYLHHRRDDHSECLVSDFCSQGTVKPKDIPSRRHKLGDHTWCLESDCPAGVLTRESRRDRRRESQRESREPDLTFPDPPLSGEGKGKGARVGTGSRPLTGRDRPSPPKDTHHLPPPPPLLPMTVVMGEVVGTLDDDDVLEPEPGGPW